MLHAARRSGLRLVRPCQRRRDRGGRRRAERLDRQRRPESPAVARGRDEPDEEAIYRNNPELPEILRTEFTALVVGYLGPAGSYEQRLPRRPCRLHAFAHAARPEEVREFAERLDFLQTLIAGGGAVADELVAACLREAAAAKGGDRGYLVRAGKELAVLLGSDVNRLTAVLKRIRA